MLPLPEGIRLSLSGATRLNDADLLRRAHADILVSLAGSPQERVGRDILVLCAETAVKVRLQSYSLAHPLATLMAAVRSTHTFPVLVLPSKQLRATSIATNALELYFLESSEPKLRDGEGNALELKDQFVCRAWYAKALLHAIGCEGQTGHPQLLARSMLSDFSSRDSARSFRPAVSIFGLRRQRALCRDIPTLTEDWNSTAARRILDPRR